ncbi:MAG: arginine--tRNA ligase [Candidatus Paraimprobicoccus trichonymphae]|uniref:Arginine--tRNA ligase n=1 Tax=Candidatus Paraimprobicoccus trichonymphae TaxID=3033793 RepID=A0AA48KXI6_9FIRM|nr:MAG: arginine--tRNA ligase [Candidatus Paraimprobicoccus trichonymphae]
MSKILIDIIENIKKEINLSINNSIKKNLLISYEKNFDINIEIPANKNNGELSCNIALNTAKIFKKSPKQIAKIILNNSNFCDFIEKTEIAGVGFINFYMSQKFYSEVLKEIKLKKQDYGKINIGENKKILLEFMSANPTGPMHIGNARIGILGDCLASCLELAGYEVFREYYINDAGNQIEKFFKSLDIKYRQIYSEENIEFPEDCYHGENVKELAQEFSEIYENKYINSDLKTRKKILVNFGLNKNINKIKSDVEKYKIVFDNWFSENDLYKDNKVKEIIQKLKDKDLVYESENAVWYNAKKFGSEKNEVLTRQNGIDTYFAADIAYHYDKFKTRNFDICINVWGSDHHGHISRLKNAIKSLGINDGNLKIVLVQFVRLIKDNELIKMSKRTGKSIQLIDLIQEVNLDSIRFMFNLKEPNLKMDFDLGLAVKQDFQNPVYYVQYAHARICNIFKSLNDEILKEYENSDINLKNLNSNIESELIYYTSLYTLEIIKISRDLDPTRITRYVINLTKIFHRFYNEKKIVISKNKDLMYSRLYLCECVKIIINKILNILKVSSPEYM